MNFETDVKKKKPADCAVDDVILGKSFAKSFGWIVYIGKKIRPTEDGRSFIIETCWKNTECEKRAQSSLRSK